MPHCWKSHVAAHIHVYPLPVLVRFKLHDPWVGTIYNDPIKIARPFGLHFNFARPLGLHCNHYMFVRPWSVSENAHSS